MRFREAADAQPVFYRKQLEGSPLNSDRGEKTTPAAKVDEPTPSTLLAFRTYSYKENLFAEFERLVQDGRRFDGLIVDLMQTDFSIPLNILIKFHHYGKRLLKAHGVLLFIKADAAVTFTRDDPGGGLNFNVYDSPFGIFARYPILADYVCATVAGIDRRRMRGGGNTLANHILYTSTPVLTAKGREMKEAFETTPPQNWLLQMIDDYASVESISRVMETRHTVQADECLRMLQELETEGYIFPIFSRIQFLSQCYHNHKPFRLGRYMVAAGILSASQLEELLEQQQEEGWGRNQKTFLGLLAVRKGYLNTRELEVLLNDQYLYGGYHKVPETGTAAANSRKASIETMKNSMIGSLAAIDSAGLLQSIATARKTGTLTVEDREQNLIVEFLDGRPTKAGLGKLKGSDAVVEFLVNWIEGIFVFRDQRDSSLGEEYLLPQPLDRMLLDAALCQDQINTILQQLPARKNTILERVWNFDKLWSRLTAESSEPLRYFDDTPVSARDQENFPAIASLIDGLTTLDEVVKACDERPAHVILRAVQFFLDNKLVIVQQTSLFKPLSLFQRLAAELQESLGPEDNKSMLETSLHYVHGDSEAARRFHIDREGRVSVDLSRMKSTSTPVSVVLLELRRWMEAYLAYARRQIDPDTVDSAIARVVQTGTI